MDNKFSSIDSPTKPPGATPSNQAIDEMITKMLGLSKAERWNELEAEASIATEQYPRHIFGWQALSKVLLKLGKWLQAIDALSEVIKLSPLYADAFNDLGHAFNELGQKEEAEASYRHALKLDPKSADAYSNLGVHLGDAGQLEEAILLLRQSLTLNPDSAGVLHSLGNMLNCKGGKDDEAISCLERSIVLEPNDPDTCIDLGNMLRNSGKDGEAMAMFRRAQELRPLMTQCAKSGKADFSVVFLDAPGGGTTPIYYLVHNAPYDCHVYCVLPDAIVDLELLRSKGDVVMSLIADPDYGKEMLPLVLDVVERLERPTVNHPRLIKGTDRETVAQRLSGIPLCRVPKTMRLAGPAIAEAMQNKVFDDFAMPVLVRTAGTHGGKDFEKFFDLDAIAKFVSQKPEADYYLIEYLDYRSADGFYRKYRMFCVDGELLPYHLAIHDDWKVHHAHTDMAEQAWKRQEEESFLRDPHLVFDERHHAVLHSVAATLGLDYFGIDCALDCNGNIVVFEANAAMLAHDEKEGIFAYKNPYIAKIKNAFTAMLARIAKGATKKGPTEISAGP